MHTKYPNMPAVLSATATYMHIKRGIRGKRSVSLSLSLSLLSAAECIRCINVRLCLVAVWLKTMALPAKIARTCAVFVFSTQL